MLSKLPFQVAWRWTWWSPGQRQSIVEVDSSIRSGAATQHLRRLAWAVKLGEACHFMKQKSDQHLCMLQVPRACFRCFFPFFLLQGSEMRSCNIGILKLFLRLHSSCTLAHQFHQCFIACSKPWNSSRWSFQTCAVASPIPSNNQSPELLLHAACQLTWWSWWPQSIRHGPCHCRSEKLKRYISPSAVIAKTSSPLIAPKLHSTDLCEKSGTTPCIDVMLWWPHSALYLQGWDNAFLFKKQKWNLHLGYHIP